MTHIGLDDSAGLREAAPVVGRRSDPQAAAQGKRYRPNPKLATSSWVQPYFAAEA
jgi:hypothetical protein